MKTYIANNRSIEYNKRLRAEIKELEKRVQRLKFAIVVMGGVMVLLGMMLIQDGVS